MCIRDRQYAVHAESGSGAENCADVGRVHNIFQNNKTAGSLTKLFHRGKLRTFHSAEHTAGQGKACQLCEHLKCCLLYTSDHSTLVEYSDFIAEFARGQTVRDIDSRFITCDLIEL